MKNKNIISTVFSAFLSFVFVAVAVYAATTISTDISTGGTLTVSGTATSTFTGGIQTNLLNIISSTATSTAANGWNLTAGCFAVNGTCIGTLTHTHQLSKTITNPAAADDYILMKFNKAATITKITGIHSGGTSVTFNIQECNASGASCADNLTSCVTSTSGADCAINDTAIDANDWIKLSTESVSGAVTYWTFTIVYTITE